MLEKILKKAGLKDVFIISVSSIAVVAFWKGAWNLFDTLFMPNNFLWSQIWSMVLGILILLILSRYGGWGK